MTRAGTAPATAAAPEDDILWRHRRGELEADIGRTVFARAVKWHCEDRVLLHGNTTIVF
jgi:hypothetical protein